ncbi:MAG TPA: nucleotide exchange factor GrpE [Candidatus Cybelea sp.]|nr:nucleotide exchange factor GrpE [Candidatus Cybelea sp.]
MMTDDKTDHTTPDENGSQAPAESGPTDLDPALQAARDEAAQLKDQLLRAMAETENTRRRAQRDRDDAQKYAVTNFAREMLTVADNLRRALEAIPAESLASDEALKTLYEGIAATERQLEAALSKQQIKRIWPEGERFDSNLHQAMFEVPDTGQPAGTVVQVLQAGYTIHDRLLRPALVGVAKGGAPANDVAPGSIDTTV